MGGGGGGGKLELIHVNFNILSYLSQSWGSKNARSIFFSKYFKTTVSFVQRPSTTAAFLFFFFFIDFV